MSTKKTITLVSVADNYFIPLLAALIKSIDINHRSDELINYYIVDDHISSANKKRLQAGFANPKINVIWVSIADVLPRGGALPLDNSTFPLSVYVRLFLPSFIPADVESIIYLDVDMLVLEDISKLWYTNIEGKTIAAVVDRAKVVSSEWGGIKNYKELGLSAETKYFNTGLLIINLEKWRSENRTGQVLKCLRDNTAYLSFPDQYGMNVAFANQWHELDSRWNTFPMSDEQNPFLIHFIDRKPIFKRYNYNQKYKEIFFQYLNLTSWKNYKRKSEFSRMAKKLFDLSGKKIKKLFRTSNSKQSTTTENRPVTTLEFQTSKSKQPQGIN